MHLLLALAEECIRCTTLTVFGSKRLHQEYQRECSVNICAYAGGQETICT